MEKLQTLLLTAVAFAKLNDSAEVLLRNRNCRLDKAIKHEPKLVKYLFKCILCHCLLYTHGSYSVADLIL